MAKKYYSELEETLKATPKIAYMESNRSDTVSPRRMVRDREWNHHGDGDRYQHRNPYQATQEARGNNDAPTHRVTERTNTMRSQNPAEQQEDRRELGGEENPSESSDRGIDLITYCGQNEETKFSFPTIQELISINRQPKNTERKDVINEIRIDAAALLTYLRPPKDVPDPDMRDDKNLVVPSTSRFPSPQEPLSPQTEFRIPPKRGDTYRVENSPRETPQSHGSQEPRGNHWEYDYTPKERPRNRGYIRKIPPYVPSSPPRERDSTDDYTLDYTLRVHSRTRMNQGNRADGAPEEAEFKATYSCTQNFNRKDELPSLGDLIVFKSRAESRTTSETDPRTCGGSVDMQTSNRHREPRHLIPYDSQCRLRSMSPEPRYRREPYVERADRYRREPRQDIPHLSRRRSRSMLPEPRHRREDNWESVGRQSRKRKREPRQDIPDLSRRRSRSMLPEPRHRREADRHRREPRQDIPDLSRRRSRSMLPEPRHRREENTLPVLQRPRREPRHDIHHNSRSRRRSRSMLPEPRHQREQNQERLSPNNQREPRLDIPDHSRRRSGSMLPESRHRREPCWKGEDRQPNKEREPRQNILDHSRRRSRSMLPEPRHRRVTCWKREDRQPNKEREPRQDIPDLSRRRSRSMLPEPRHQREKNQERLSPNNQREPRQDIPNTSLSRRRSRSMSPEPRDRRPELVTLLSPTNLRYSQSSELEIKEEYVVKSGTRIISSSSTSTTFQRHILTLLDTWPQKSCLKKINQQSDVRLAELEAELEKELELEQEVETEQEVQLEEEVETEQEVQLEEELELEPEDEAEAEAGPEEELGEELEEAEAGPEEEPGEELEVEPEGPEEEAEEPEEEREPESSQRVSQPEPVSECSQGRPLPLVLTNPTFREVWRRRSPMGGYQCQSPNATTGGLYSRVETLRFRPIDRLDSGFSSAPILEGAGLAEARVWVRYFAREFDRNSQAEQIQDIELRIAQLRILQRDSDRAFYRHYDRHRPPIRPVITGGITVPCPMGNSLCPWVTNETLLGHMLTIHRYHQGMHQSEIFRNERILVPFNPRSFDIGANICIAVLMYGGMMNDRSALPTFMPSQNTDLPLGCAHYSRHVPVLLMMSRNRRCAVQDPRRVSFEGDSNEHDDVLALWAVSVDLQQPLHMMMTVMNRRMDVTRSCILHVRSLHTCHEAQNFMSSSPNYMLLSEVDLCVLTSDNTEPLYLEFAVREYANPHCPCPCHSRNRHNSNNHN